jgi:antibiotic biosynthesis monooxygenase (ABM) superfamily enzyme
MTLADGWNRSATEVQDAEQPVRSLIMAFLVVAVLTYFLMPRLTKLFYRWLYPR